MLEEEFTLNDAITYQDAGDPNAQCHQLFLTAPSAKVIRHCGVLKQAIMSQYLKMNNAATVKEALKDIKPETLEAIKNAKKENKDDGKALLDMLYMSDCDLNKCFDAFRSICTSGSVKTPNHKAITEIVIDKMSARDFERLLGFYLENFIIGSE